MKTTHTPTPFLAVRENEYRTNIETEAGRVIGATFGEWEDGPEEHAQIAANAAFIVRAVNAHEALVEALKGLMPFVAEDFPENFPEEPSGWPVTHAYAQAFIAAKKALALAEKAEPSP